MDDYVRRFKSLVVVSVALFLALSLLWSDLSNLNRTIQEVEDIAIPYVLLTAKIGGNASIKPDEDSWHDGERRLPNEGSIFSALQTVDRFFTYRFSGSISLQDGENVFYKRLLDSERDAVIGGFLADLERRQWFVVGDVTFEVLAVNFPNQNVPAAAYVLADKELLYGGYGNLATEARSTILLGDNLVAIEGLESTSRRLANRWVVGLNPEDTYIALKEIRKNRTFKVPVVGVEVKLAYLSFLISFFCLFAGMVMLHTTQAMCLLQTEYKNEPWIYYLPISPKSLAERMVSLFGCLTVLPAPFLIVVCCLINLFVLSPSLFEKSVGAMCCVVTMCSAGVAVANLLKIRRPMGGEKDVS